MSDNTTGNDGAEPGARILDFPRIGFNLTPTTTPAVPPMPAAPPTPNSGTRTGRLSPLDALASLPDPGITRPVIPTLPAAPGTVPATFQSEPAPDMTGPRLGALSLAACLAVAVAALRGSHTVLSTWWENRLARQSETAPLREARLKHQLAMQNIADKGAQQNAKHNRVPSSSEFGRKSLGGRSGGKSSGSSLFGSTGSGGGRGRSGKTNSSSGSAGATRNPKAPKKTTPKSPGSGLGLGGGTKNNSRTRKQTPKTPKSPKSPHRASQGGGAALKKHRTNTPRTTDKTSNGNGKNTPRKNNRSSLAGALTGDTHKAAQRRLNRRRKHGLDKPALWPGDTRTNRKGPKHAKDLKGRKDRAGKDTSARKATPGTKNPRVRKDGADMKLGPTAWRDLRKAANRRWKRRQKREGRAIPPLWRDAAARTRKAKADATSPKASTKATGDAKPGKPTAPGAKTGDSRSQWWERARDYARKHGRNGDFFGGDNTAAPDPQYAAGPQPGAGTAAGDSSDGAGPIPGDWTRQRATPFQNAAQAAGPSNWTVTSEHVPDSQNDQRQPSGIPTRQAALPRLGTPALDAAPTPHTARPGTSRPKEPIAMPPAPVPARQDPRILKAKKQAARAAVATVGREMDAQHETEITLDDACDAADQLMDDGFKTHDQSARLSEHARRLREAWLVLADDCATNNNLTGTLYTAAAIKFAESVELVARMADEMTISSLEAAEKSETAGNEINDAYRPISQATADAGLATPSAPVHNQV